MLRNIKLIAVASLTYTILLATEVVAQTQSVVPTMESWRFWGQIGTIVVSAIGIIATATIAIANLVFNRKREHEQIARDERRETLSRTYVPRTEYDLNCYFHGPRSEHYILDLRLTVENRGVTRRYFKSMKIRALGIRTTDTLALIPEQMLKPDNNLNANQLLFPSPLFSTDLIKQGHDWFYFVDPSITQTFTFVTIIPTDVEYVLVNVNLLSKSSEADAALHPQAADESIFVEERLFPVRANSDRPEARRTD